mgnify:CR=1 FL=1
MKETVRNVCDRQNRWTKAFNEYEALRAEQIMKALEGLSIRSAKALLSKVDDYLLEELVTIVI